MESIQSNNKTLYRTPFGWWNAEICAKAKPYWGCVIDKQGTRIKTNTIFHDSEKKGENTPIPAKVNYEYMNFKIALLRAEMKKVKNPYKTKIEDYIDEAIRLARIYRNTDITAPENKSYNELINEVEDIYKAWWNYNYNSSV